MLTLTAPPTTTTVPDLARTALAGDPTAIDALRALGQPGLDALVALRRSLSSVPPLFVGEQTPAVNAWEALIDAVARQRYASASGLYWHTDLEEAKARARREGKPILSLRLLGALDEDFSCANSRFFRTILYPDPAIARALHDGWVLHWESVRKAPKIEIDFGDGRKLVRTITGNSLHYAMTADGEVTDLLPGMVGPQAFSAWLERAGTSTTAIAARPPRERAAAIRARLTADLAERMSAWQAALSAVGVEGSARDVERLAAATDEQVIARLAARKRVRISREAEALIGPMMPGRTARFLAADAMPIAITKAAVEAPMLRLATPVEGTLARDEVNNELVVKSRTLVVMLGADHFQEAGGVPALTAAIYREVFLTPLDDPWMGLAPADVFTALPPELEKVGASR